MATKREKIVELFKNKPKDYVIAYPVQAVQYLIDSGFINSLTAEELIEDPQSDGVWDCWLEAITPPVEEKTEDPI